MGPWAPFRYATARNDQTKKRTDKRTDERRTDKQNDPESVMPHINCKKQTVKNKLIRKQNYQTSLS